jgi:uncharacterized DUF497 family protein
VIYEWDPRKAKANLQKHRVSFEEAATVFLDPLVVTYPDPDHSEEESREITVGYSTKQRVILLSHTQWGGRTRIIGARKASPANSMKKTSVKKNGDDLRPEYDLSKLKAGVRGKYYRRATAGTNLVLIEPDLAEVFPDADAVNRALRILANAAGSIRQRGRGKRKQFKRSA